MNTNGEIYIVDAMNYVFRAYHALPRDITSPHGMLTNAVLGYARTLLRIIKEKRPQYLVAAFEGEGSFRTEMFSEYKANRKEMPPDLAPQIDYCRRITHAMGVAAFHAAAFEADDVIGTVAVRMRALGHPVVIVTGDKDMSQLVCDGIRVYDMAKELWLDEAAVREKFGVAPSQIPDLLALHGDAIDNIPGVPGVGEKTARQILALCSGIEDLAHPSNLFDGASIRSRDQVLERIRQNFERLRLSRKLAAICCEVPITVTPESVRYRRGDGRLLSPLCAELGLRRIVDDIPLAQPTLF